MTDDLRAKYWEAVQANRAAYLEQRAETKPKRTLAQRVRDFGSELARRANAPALRVEPKHRISGPRLVVDGHEWHTCAGQAKLSPPVLGPKCANCRQPVFAGSDTLHGLGLCGECYATLGTTIAAPPLHSEPDGPDHPRAA